MARWPGELHYVVSTAIDIGRDYARMIFDRGLDKGYKGSEISTPTICDGLRQAKIVVTDYRPLVDLAREAADGHLRYLREQRQYRASVLTDEARAERQDARWARESEEAERLFREAPLPPVARRPRPQHLTD
jgi:hypothetical protein